MKTDRSTPRPVVGQLRRAARIILPVILCAVIFGGCTDLFGGRPTYLGQEYLIGQWFGEDYSGLGKRLSEICFYDDGSGTYAYWWLAIDGSDGEELGHFSWTADESQLTMEITYLDGTSETVVHEYAIVEVGDEITLQLSELFDLDLAYAQPLGFGAEVTETELPDAESRDLVYGGGYLWLLGDESNLLYKLDLDGNVVDSADIGAECTWSWNHYRTHSYGIDYWDNTIFVADQSDQARILHVDPDTMNVTGQSTKPEFSTQGLAHDDSGNTLFIKTTYVNLSVDEVYLTQIDGSGSQTMEEESPYEHGLDYVGGSYCTLFPQASPGDLVRFFDVSTGTRVTGDCYKAPVSDLLAITSDGEGTFWALDAETLYRFTIQEIANLHAD